MKYRVCNIDTRYICGPVGDYGKYLVYSVQDSMCKPFGSVFETTDINIAYQYRLVMDRENAAFYPRGYEVIEVE